MPAPRVVSRAGMDTGSERRRWPGLNVICRLSVYLITLPGLSRCCCYPPPAKPLSIADIPPLHIAACRRFDAKNCTLLSGLLNSTGACIFREQVDNVTWAALNATAASRRMPADEFFQYVTPPVFILYLLCWYSCICFVCV